MKLPAQTLLLAAAVVALAAAMPASAQDTPAAPAADAPAATPEAAPGTAPATDAPAPAAPAAPAATGTADPAAPEVMEVVRATFGDWEVRCAPTGNDCFMYQLAKDAGQNPVAEVSILKLPAQAEATAGVTIVTPLGTLLPPGIGLQVDTGDRRAYPFGWCSPVGCFARFGLDDASLAALKRGKRAKLSVASVGAPDRPIVLDVSLKGFTAAYDSLEIPVAPAAASTAPAAPAAPAAAPTIPAPQQ